MREGRLGVGVGVGSRELVGEREREGEGEVVPEREPERERDGEAVLLAQVLVVGDWGSAPWRQRNKRVPVRMRAAMRAWPAATPQKEDVSKPMRQHKEGVFT